MAMTTTPMSSEVKMTMVVAQLLRISYGNDYNTEQTTMKSQL